MEKLIYLAFCPDGVDLDAHRDTLIDVCAPALVKEGAHGILLNVKDSDASVSSPSKGMTGRKPFTAQISVWVDDVEERAGIESVLRSHSEILHGYLVTESLYTDYGQNGHAGPRDFSDGERSPFVLTVTLLEKPDRFDYESWLRHWYGTQSPVSEAMQPRARYVRNAVARVLTEGSPPYLGIVEEAWPSARHIEDPYLFYGAHSFDELVSNMTTMIRSVTGFLDLPRIQTVTMSEYMLKTPSFAEL